MIMRRPHLLFAVLMTALLMSCASMMTSKSHYAKAEDYVAQQNYDEAAAVIEDAKGVLYQEKDRVLYYLDLGMLYHYAGRYEESNEALTEAEYAIEELYTQSIVKAIGSGILNDNALDYNGEVYEDLYINIFKSLNYISLDDTESALVEVRRMNNKLNLLQDKYNLMYDQYVNSGEDSQAVVGEIENDFHNDVLARYLGCILYRNIGDYDDAGIDKSLISEAFLSQPQFYPFSRISLPEAGPSEPETIPVNFFAFTGQSPNKVATTYYINTSPDMLYFVSVEQNSEDYLQELTGLRSMYFPGIEGGFHIKFQFPRMEKRNSSVNRIVVSSEGSPLLDLELAEDMAHIAHTTFTKELPLIVGKTVTRALIKGVLKEAADQALDEELQDAGAGVALLKSLFDFATDVAVDSTENADLRISNFFPAKAYTGEVSLTPGVYDFQVDYYNGGYLVYSDYLENLEINRKSSIIESFFIF